MLKISVIIPIYNVEAYLKQCVDSVLNQTFSNIEVVLVDDGSKDDCPAICDEYAQQDSRVKVIHKQNGGLVSARKAGAEIATGNYTVCVDGDDWIDKNHIEVFAKIIETYSPDVIICGAKRAYVEHDEEIELSYRHGFYSKENIVKEIFPTLIQNENAQYFVPSVWAKAYRTELYVEMQGRVDERIKIGEDRACVIPCIYNAESLFITPESTYYYRQNSLSMTKERKSFAWDGPKLIHNHLLCQIDIDRYDFREQLYRETVHELFLVVVSQFYRCEKNKVIRKDIKFHLKDPVYHEAIQRAVFKGIKGRIVSLTLRFGCCRMIHLIGSIWRGR